MTLLMKLLFLSLQVSARGPALPEKAVTVGRRWNDTGSSARVLKQGRMYDVGSGC